MLCSLGPAVEKVGKLRSPPLHLVAVRKSNTSGEGLSLFSSGPVDWHHSIRIGEYKTFFFGLPASSSPQICYLPPGTSEAVCDGPSLPSLLSKAPGDLGACQVTGGI